MKNIFLSPVMTFWLILMLVLNPGAAMAQAEPTVQQIEASAQAGKLDEAQAMVQKVLTAHPKSAKAYFVQAQLYARQSLFKEGQASLAQAEKLAPGLTFAKPEAVQALRARLSNAPAVTTTPTPTPVIKRPPAAGGLPWGWILLIGGGVLLLGYLLFRRQEPAVQYGVGGQPVSGGGYGSTPGAAGFPGSAAAQPGMGQRIMGGVATGLAVGAGMVAGEAIARNLMGGDHGSSGSSGSASRSSNDFEPISNNDSSPNFGITDTSSWDDAGSSDGGGGGDWDT